VWGPRRLLPLGSAPQTSPAAQLRYRDRAGLTALTHHRHPAQQQGCPPRGWSSSRWWALCLEHPQVFNLQKSAKTVWARSWAPSEVFAEQLGLQSTACCRGWAEPVAMAVLATQPVCPPRTPAWPIADRGCLLGSGEGCSLAAHLELGTAASPEVPDDAGGNFTSIKWEFLLKSVRRLLTQAGAQVCARWVTRSSRDWKCVRIMKISSVL